MPDAAVPQTQRTLTDADLKALVEALHVHTCRFDDNESKSLHQFAQSIANGGWEKWVAIIEFGGTLIQVKKAGVVAVVGLVVAALVGALWVGINVKLGLR